MTCSSSRRPTRFRTCIARAGGKNRSQAPVSNNSSQARILGGSIRTAVRRALLAAILEPDVVLHALAGKPARSRKKQATKGESNMRHGNWRVRVRTVGWATLVSCALVLASASALAGKKNDTLVWLTEFEPPTYDFYAQNNREGFI